MTIQMSGKNERNVREEDGWIQGWLRIYLQSVFASSRYINKSLQINRPPTPRELIRQHLFINLERERTKFPSTPKPPRGPLKMYVKGGKVHRGMRGTFEIPPDKINWLNIARASDDGIGILVVLLLPSLLFVIIRYNLLVFGNQMDHHLQRFNSM